MRVCGLKADEGGGGSKAEADGAPNDALANDAEDEAEAG